MKPLIAIFLYLAAIGVAVAACPRWAGVIVDSSKNDEILTVALVDAVSISKNPEPKSHASLISSDGHIHLVKIMGFHQNTEQHQQKNEFQSVVINISDKKKIKDATHIFYPAFSGRARLKSDFPELNSRDINKKPTNDFFNISVDTDGDGRSDLVMQAFCRKNGCSNEYTISEVHAKTDGTWMFCGKIDPM